MLQTRLLAYY